MKKKESILNFEAVKEESLEKTSKVGGQPNWLEKPEWPLSRTLGKQMRFIAQVKINKDLFPESKAEMAYIYCKNTLNVHLPHDEQTLLYHIKILEI